MTSIIENGRQPHFLENEDNLNDLIIINNAVLAIFHRTKMSYIPVTFLDFHSFWLSGSAMCTGGTMCLLNFYDCDSTTCLHIHGAAWKKLGK